MVIALRPAGSRLGARRGDCLGLVGGEPVNALRSERLLKEGRSGRRPVGPKGLALGNFLLMDDLALGVVVGLVRGEVIAEVHETIITGRKEFASAGAEGYTLRNACAPCEGTRAPEEQQKIGN